MQSKHAHAVIAKPEPAPAVQATCGTRDAALGPASRAQRNGSVLRAEQPAPPGVSVRRARQAPREPEVPSASAPRPRCRWNADYL